MDSSKTNAPRVQRPAGWTFGMVDTTIIRDQSLPRNVKSVYAYFTTWCGDTRSAFPSRGRIARETGLSVRTLDEALSIGEAAGLWRIVRRPVERGRHETSVYELLDQGQGYVVGSGPVEVKVPRPRQGADSAPTSVQVLHPVGAGSAPETDNVIQTSSTQTSTSGDSPSGPHADARGSEGAPRDEEPNDPKLYLPRTFETMAEPAVRKKLVGAALTALEAVGLRPADNAADRMGEALRHYSRTEKHDRHRLAEHVTKWLADPAGHGLLYGAPVSVEPAPVLPDPFSEDYGDDLIECIEERIGSSMHPAVAQMVDGMLSEGREGQAIYNAAIARERDGNFWHSA